MPHLSPFHIQRPPVAGAGGSGEGGALTHPRPEGAQPQRIKRARPAWPRPPLPRRTPPRATGGRLREVNPDGLGLGVVLEARRPQLTPEPRFLEAAERQRRVEEVVGVDPYGARADCARRL